MTDKERIERIDAAVGMTRLLIQPNMPASPEVVKEIRKQLAIAQHQLDELMGRPF